ncbi:MAG: hypothetical protein M5U22_04120 [Thermoleophilia bacterium]|nr:hypothetical protein [Thermoleophilia bacterium]
MSVNPSEMPTQISSPFDATSRDAGAPLTVRQTTLWGDVVRRFARNRAAMLGLTVLVILLLYSTVGPWIRPFSYSAQDFSIANQLPGSVHWFGTDFFGRDLFVRMAMGDGSPYWWPSPLPAWCWSSAWRTVHWPASWGARSMTL